MKKKGDNYRLQISESSKSLPFVVFFCHASLQVNELEGNVRRTEGQERN